jgi:hypothetical protein
VLLNPLRNFLVACPGGDDIFEFVRCNASKSKKHVVDRTIKVVFAKRVVEGGATFIQCPHPDDVARQQFPWAPWIILG